MHTNHTIGIIGGGQLAQMMYQATIGLGLTVKLLSEAADSPAAVVMPEVMVGDYTNPATLLEFAKDCDALTFDHEHVPTALLHELIVQGCTVHPSPDALEYTQDKALMRQRLSAMGLPCPQYAVVKDAAELIQFGNKIGWPIIAKTTRGGYDGKGVFLLSDPSAASLPFIGLSEVSAGAQVQIVAEEFIDFDRELSVILVRSATGQTSCYPISQTTQVEGICVETLTPAPGLTDEMITHTLTLARKIADELAVVGVLAVELMQAKDGRILINELAMRPHNTGHWTIEGAATSQFENHIRAVAGLPLGSAELLAPAVAMVNVLGGKQLDLSKTLPKCLAADTKAHVHLYRKPVRPRRKIGHVTTLGKDATDVLNRARLVTQLLTGETND